MRADLTWGKPYLAQAELCARIADALTTDAVHLEHGWRGYDTLARLKLPGPDYLDVLSALHRTLKPKLYVEIGVRKGDSLHLALPETRCIGIDPKLSFGAIERPNTVLCSTTSDEFFADEGRCDRVRGFDLALIDGDHSFDQALRDFKNLERLAKPSSVVCIHDVIPMDERTAQPEPIDKSAFHTGDVWRLMRSIVKKRRDLIAFTVACPPSGLGIVGRFNPFAEGALRPLCPFPATWAEQVDALNIIPNDGAAIAAAFQRNAA
jgi:Methyltransferase domain